MAGEHDTSATDLTAHVRTYGSVITLLKWGAVACVVIAALVIWIIS